MLCSPFFCFTAKRQVDAKDAYTVSFSPYLDFSDGEEKGLYPGEKLRGPHISATHLPLSLATYVFSVFLDYAADLISSKPLRDTYVSDCLNTFEKKQGKIRFRPGNFAGKRGYKIY